MTSMSSSIEGNDSSKKSDNMLSNLASFGTQLSHIVNNSQADIHEYKFGIEKNSGTVVIDFVFKADLKQKSV